jgi:hypothetical protein
MEDDRQPHQPQPDGWRLPHHRLGLGCRAERRQLDREAVLAQNRRQVARGQVFEIFRADEECV